LVTNTCRTVCYKDDIGVSTSTYFKTKEWQFLDNVIINKNTNVDI
jgi:hypothetical protein